MTEPMKIKAIAPWLGSNRTLAKYVGEELAGCPWVGVPFAGAMCEVPSIDARTIVLNDKHDNIINLARVIADDSLRAELVKRLDNKLFHPRELLDAQVRCRDRMEADGGLFECGLPVVDAAEDYFVAVWMNRSAKAGTDDEFTGALPVRWNANGGDSNTRYRSAVESLDAWGTVLKRCNFRCDDALDFIQQVPDHSNNAIYCDPPFPDVGGEYRHKFDEQQHRQLASKLSAFLKTRVVCRFYDHPLVRELYPESIWTWRKLAGGRDQANQNKPEVLLINGHSFVNEKGLFDA